jgi:hypothetical protein
MYEIIIRVKELSINSRFFCSGWLRICHKTVKLNRAVALNLFCLTQKKKKKGCYYSGWVNVVELFCKTKK